MRLFAAAPMLAAFVLGCGLGAQKSLQPSTLTKVRASHVLSCGVVQEDAEYSTEEDHSSRGGFDEGLCGAVAVAVDPRTRVKLTSFLDEVSAVKALQTGKLDVIATLSADARHRYRRTRLSRIVFYDALALLTPVSGGLQQPADLAGKKICVLAETGNEESLRAWYAQHRVDYLPFPFQEEGEMEAAYVSNNCAALAADRTRLSLIRVSMGSGAAEHVILPEELSRDPMASATRAGDPAWSRAVDAVVGALLLAEERGVNSKSFDETEKAHLVETFLRETTERGARLGLWRNWAGDVLRSVGNYEEMYERTLGRGSDRQLPRDVNRVRSAGGLLLPLQSRPGGE